MATVENPHFSLDWLDGEKIRPYIFVREENRTVDPGSRFDSDWFPFPPIYFNPLHMDQVTFADQIMRLESGAFDKSGMAMPRWVFYDCGIMPGFVAGFACHRDHLKASHAKALAPDPSLEWIPISLFIIIPARAQGEWVAHNLSSINALVEKDDRLYGLGFLTKAFGLWYANIGICCGMTQWQSPAIRLHSHYGAFEVLTAYTPVHSYARTLTYRLQVDPLYWALFFSKNQSREFITHYKPAGFQVDPKNDDSLKAFQRRIENNEGPFFLDSQEIRNQPLDAELSVYLPRK
ncbi:MAG: hypothetical protein H6626_01780 [Pseudobdellovibrionaceae bacterium]|nr:hypothetical protein [Bdellovibrionales bacterium]USN47847.1 MAG: hypothetical protein H6626_01780 [Pseudobdellovibrionaceae bacterium]